MSAPTDVDESTERASAEEDSAVRAMTNGALRLVANDGSDGELPDYLPEIQVKRGALSTIIPAAVDALASSDENIFQRNNELVAIAIEPDPGVPFEQSRRRGTHVTLRPGTPRIREVGAAELTERLAASAEWLELKPETKREAARWVAADPPVRVVNAVRERADKRGVRQLRGIIEAPALRPDGSVIESPGYDAATGLMYVPSCEFPRVPSNPSQADARAALKRLWIEMLSDFPYRGLGESDPSTDPDYSKRYEKACSSPDAFVAIAALLSCLARSAIRGAVPGTVYEAASPGTGKSLHMNAITMVATGRAASMMTFPISRGAPNEEELEKVLSSFALAGASFLPFDNIRGQLGGAALEKALTCEDKISLRVLGVSQTRELSWSMIVMFSGNNMSMSDDTMQRCLISRLESEREDPRKRAPEEFRHPDLLGALRARRPQLLIDALTVLRAFVIADADTKAVTQRESGTIGSFSEWSKLVPAAIRYAGGARVVEARPDIGDAGMDAESEAETLILEHWPFQGLVSASTIVATVFADTYGGPPDDMGELRAAFRTLCRTPDGSKPSSIAVGRRLRGLRGKWRGGFKIDAIKDEHAKIQLWQRTERGQPAPPPEPPPTQPVAPPPPSPLDISDALTALTATAIQEMNAATDVAQLEGLRSVAKRQLEGHPGLERVASVYRTKVRELRGETS